MNYKAINCLIALFLGICFAEVNISISQPTGAHIIKVDQAASFQTSTYSVSGLSGWNKMAVSFRLALMGTTAVSFSNPDTGIFDLGFALSNMAGMAISAAVCILFALMALVFLPFEAFDAFKEITKLTDEQKEKKRLKEEAEEEELIKKGIKPTIKKVEDEETDKLSIYGKDQIYFAWTCLVVSVIICIVSIVYGLAGNSIAGTSFSKVSDMSEGILSGTENAVLNFSVLLSQRYSKDSLYPVADALSKVDETSPLLQTSFASIVTLETEISSALNDLQTQMNVFTNIISNMSAAVNNLTNIGRTISSLSQPNILAGYSNPILWSCKGRAEVGTRDYTGLLPLTYDYLSSDMPNFDAGGVATFGSFYQGQLSSLASTSTNFWNSVQNLIISPTVSNLKNYGVKTDQALLSGLEWVQLSIDSAKGLARAFTASYEQSNGTRAMTTYVALTFAFLLISIGTSSILFNKMKIARAANVLNVLFLIIIWVLCGVTLGYSVLNGEVCREAVEYRFSNWRTNFQRQLDLQSMPLINVTRHLEQVFTARDECYNGIPLTLYSEMTSLGSQFRQEMLPIADLSILGDGYAAAANIIGDAMSNMDPHTGSFAQTMQNWVTGIANMYIVSYRGGSIQGSKAFRWAVNMPIRYLISVAQSPSFHHGISLPDVKAQLLNDMYGVTPDMFSANPPNQESSCATNYKNVYISGFVDSYYSSLVSNVAQIDDAKAAVLKYAYAALDAQNKLRELQFKHDALISMRNPISTTLGSMYLTVSALTNTQRAVNTYLWNVVANFISPSSRYEIATAVNCQPMAQMSYQAETEICTNMQYGYDAAFWALGAMGVFYALHIFAVKICVTRCYEDPRWLVMASLLKATQNLDKNSGKSAEALPKAKINATGTTYLDEKDFDVSFVQPKTGQHNTGAYNMMPK